jgi:hypothetical protein
MMRGQGRVFQRKYRDKRTGKVKVAATFTLEYYLDGTMCREASGTTSYTEAVRQLKRRQGEIAQGRRVAPAADRLTFEHLAANLVGDYRAHGRRSLERVEDALAHLRAMFSGYRARTIDGALVTNGSRLARQPPETLFCRGVNARHAFPQAAALPVGEQAFEGRPAGDPGRGQHPHDVDDVGLRHQPPIEEQTHHDRRRGA